MPASGACPTTAITCPDGSVMPAGGSCTKVEGVVTENPPAVLGEEVQRPTEVEGVSLTAAPTSAGAQPRAVEGASLARTGLEIAGLMASAAVLLGAGALLLAATRRRRGARSVTTP